MVKPLLTINDLSVDEDPSWLVGDRKWFENNPNRTYYQRAFVDGELPSEVLGNFHPNAVIVKQRKPGVRLRFPVYVEVDFGDDEKAMEALVELILSGKGTSITDANEFWEYVHGEKH